MCLSVPPPFVLMVAMPPRLLVTSSGVWVQLWKQRAVSSPEPFSPDKPPQSFLTLVEGRAEQSRGPGVSLQGSGHPGTGEIISSAEVTMKLPVRAASRQGRLQPISGTVLFPVCLQLHSSFQAGPGLCCFLIVDFQFPCCSF